MRSLRRIFRQIQSDLSPIAALRENRRINDGITFMIMTFVQLARAVGWEVRRAVRRPRENDLSVS